MAQQKRGYHEIIRDIETIREDMARAFHNSSVVDLHTLTTAVLSSLRRAQEQNTYGPIMQATFCLGRLYSEAQAVALTPKMRREPVLKEMVREWSRIARDLVAEIADRADPVQPVSVEV